MKIYPKKSLGQNFLVNEGVLEKLVSAAELTNRDTVLEVGPGTGNLTKNLSKRAHRVIAVEKDRRLIEELRNYFSPDSKEFSNVKIIEGDILRVSPASISKASGETLRGFEYKIVANIPYYITSNFLRTVLEKWSRSSDDRGSSTKSGPKPKLIVLTVQKEVAKRIVAKPPDMNLLALSVQLYSEPKIISYISRGSFRPIPKVDSAIIRLTTYDKLPTTSPEKVLRIAKKAFAGKRKQLKNTLREVDFKFLNINPESRPEELKVDEWIRIADSLT